MRILIGLLLVAHGLAHAGAGMWSGAPVWLVTLLWWVATICFVSAGFGMLGFQLFRRRAMELTYVAAVASLILLASFPGWFVVPGLVLDVALFLTVVHLNPAPALNAVVTRPRVSWRSRVAAVVSIGFLAYTSGVILLRPWAMRLGTTSSDRQASLFGDSITPRARYRIDNAITIAAPADSVWPWLAQIGQDRGGFYSYDVLERLFGVDIANADSLVPAWQDRKVGDLVRATQPTYLGGIFGPDLGWRIVAIDPGRAMVLDKWGAFVVRPIDNQTSQFYIRQRNPGAPSLAGNLLAPIGLLVFEPAHFIMQRGTLRGIKERAERG